MSSIMSTMTMVPAYNRDYKSKKAVLADWHAGKDFNALAPDGSSAKCNKEDLKNFHSMYGTVEIKIRYNRLTAYVFIPLKEAIS